MVRESGAVPCRVHALAFPGVSRRPIPKLPRIGAEDLMCRQVMVPEGLSRRVHQENEEERGR